MGSCNKGTSSFGVLRLRNKYDQVGLNHKLGINDEVKYVLSHDYKYITIHMNGLWPLVDITPIILVVFLELNTGP